MKSLLLAMVVAAPLMAAGKPFLPESNAFVSGNQLYEWRTAADGSFKKAAGYGYVEAVADVANGLKTVTVCMPPTVTVREVVDVAQLCLHDKPGQRHFPSVFGL